MNANRCYQHVLAWKEALGGIVDDVLTVGNHFRAMSDKLSGIFPHADIVGIFVARRAIPHENFDDFDDVEL